jgi:hypothetical protein
MELEAAGELEREAGGQEAKPEGDRRRKLLMGLTGASALLGVLLLVVGAVLLAQYNVFFDFVTPRYTETAAFLLVMGVLIMAVSALGASSSRLSTWPPGLYSAMRFHFCLMTTFLAIMVAVVVMEVIAAVTFFALNNDPAAAAGTRAMLRHTLQRWWGMSVYIAQCTIYTALVQTILVL